MHLYRLEATFTKKERKLIISLPGSPTKEDFNIENFEITRVMKWSFHRVSSREAESMPRYFINISRRKLLHRGWLECWADDSGDSFCKQQEMEGNSIWIAAKKSYVTSEKKNFLHFSQVKRWLFNTLLKSEIL